MVPICSIASRHGRLRLPWLLAVAAAALTAQAEPTARPGKPDPHDPQASVPTLAYVSPFQAAAHPAGDKPIAWRAANDTVARIGGWRAYAREAQAPVPAPAPVPTPAQPVPPTTPPTKPPGHGGHPLP